MIARSSLFLLAAGTAGCFGNVATEFPPGLDPLETNLAAPPAAGGEELSLHSGRRGDLYFTHARAFIRAPLAAVWEAMKDPEVVIDRRKVDEYTWDRDVEVGYDVSFVVHAVVHDLITVNFDITWRQSAVEGSREAPELVAMRFEKTNGSTSIDVLRASLALQATEEEGVTELAVVEHLQAFIADNGIVESQIRDLHQSVIARVNGRPLPAY